MAVSEGGAAEDSSAATNARDMERDVKKVQYSKKKLQKLSQEWKTRHNKRRKKRLQHLGRDRW